MWNLIVNGRMGSVFAGDSHVVRYWRPQIQGTVTENLPSTAEAYQICKCSLRSTFPIPWTSLMTIPSPLDLANNVVKNKHFSGSGGGGLSKVYRVHMNTTLFGLNLRQKPWTKILIIVNVGFQEKRSINQPKLFWPGARGEGSHFQSYHVRCAKTFDLHYRKALGQGKEKI